MAPSSPSRPATLAPLLLLLLLSLLAPLRARGAVSVGRIFSDGMVLQDHATYDQRPFVYGLAAPGEHVTVVRTQPDGANDTRRDLVDERVTGRDEPAPEGLRAAGGGGGDTPKRSGQEEAADEFPAGRGCGWGALD
jgi:hypothetical protein